MSLSDDTADLLDTALWGELVTIRRNTPVYDDIGTETDSSGWATVTTANADIQPISGGMNQGELGEKVISTHVIFFGSGIDIIEGDRIRQSGWSTGDDEFTVNKINSHDDHSEALCSVARGHS